METKFTSDNPDSIVARVPQSHRIEEQQKQYNRRIENDRRIT